MARPARRAAVAAWPRSRAAISRRTSMFDRARPALAALATLAAAAARVLAPASAAEKKAGVQITEDTEDPAIWGKEYPREYATYKKTVDQVRTKYGGSEALPHAPEEADPRSVLSQSKIEEDPRLKTMWAGYA